MYSQNEQGILRDKYVRKESLRMFTIGPAFAVLYICLSYISMSDWLLFFYLTSPILVLLMFLLFVFAPLRMLNRHNRTISSISFEDDRVCFKTFKALWMNSKEVEIPKKQLKAKDSKFNWYGATVKEGLKFSGIPGCDFFLVKDFFKDYEMIRNGVVRENTLRGLK